MAAHWNSVSHIDRCFTIGRLQQEWLQERDAVQSESADHRRLPEEVAVVDPAAKSGRVEDKAGIAAGWEEVECDTAGDGHEDYIGAGIEPGDKEIAEHKVVGVDIVAWIPELGGEGEEGMAVVADILDEDNPAQWEGVGDRDSVGEGREGIVEGAVAAVDTDDWEGMDILDHEMAAEDVGAIGGRVVQQEDSVSFDNLMPH
jgi:hypothetical protein